MTEETKLDLIMSIVFLTYKRIQLKEFVDQRIYLAKNEKDKDTSGKDLAQARALSEKIESLDEEFQRLGKLFQEYSEEIYGKAQI